MFRKIEISRGEQGGWFEKKYGGGRSGTLNSLANERRIRQMANSTPVGDATTAVKSSDIGKVVYWSGKFIMTAEMASIISKSRSELDADRTDFLRDNLVRASQSRVASGINFTDGTSGVSLLNTDPSGKIHTSGKAEIKIQKIINATDFNDPESLNKLHDALSKFGKKIGDESFARNFNFANATDAENAVAFALAFKDSSSLVSEVKYLEKSVKQYIVDGSPEYSILGQIATGQIDVDAIIESGTFCGSPIDDKLKVALLGLQSLAAAETVATQAQTGLFNALLENDHDWMDQSTQKITDSVRPLDGERVVENMSAFDLMSSDETVIAARCHTVEMFKVGDDINAKYAELFPGSDNAETKVVDFSNMTTEQIGKVNVYELFGYNGKSTMENVTEQTREVSSMLPNMNIAALDNNDLRSLLNSKTLKSEESSAVERLIRAREVDAAAHELNTELENAHNDEKSSKPQLESTISRLKKIAEGANLVSPYHTRDTLALCRKLETLRDTKTIKLPDELKDIPFGSMSIEQLQSLDFQKMFGSNNLTAAEVLKNKEKKATELLGRNVTNMSSAQIQALMMDNHLSQKEVGALSDVLNARKKNSLANKWNDRVNKQMVPLMMREKRLAEKDNKILSKNIDFNNLKAVTERVHAMERQIDRARIPGMKGSVSKMSNKKLKKLLKSDKISGKQKEAIKSLMAMRKHQQTLQARKNMAKTMRGNIRMMALKITGAGQSDIVQGIRHLQQMKRATKMALKTARSVGKIAYKPFKPLVRKMTAPVRRRFTANMEKVRAILSKHINAVRKEVQRAAKQVANAAKNTAKEAAKKTAEKLTSKLSEKAKKALSKVGDKLKGGAKRIGNGMKRLSAFRKRRKTISSLKATKHKSLLGFLGKFKGVLIKVVAIVLVISFAFIIVSEFSSSILQPLSIFEDFLLHFWAEVEGFFYDLFHKDATPDQIEAIIPETMKLLQRMEEKETTASYWLDQNYRAGWSFYSFVDPSLLKENVSTAYGCGVKRIPYDDSELVDKSQSLLIFQELFEKVPDKNSYYVRATNNYSVTKLVLSMAHGFTFEITQQAELGTFTEYSIGLWHHLNWHRVECNLLLTSATSSFYTYNCTQEDSDGNELSHYNGGLYSCVVVPNKSIGESIAVTLQNKTKDTDFAGPEDKLVIIDGDLAPQTQNGCVTYKYSAVSGTWKKYLNSGTPGEVYAEEVCDLVHINDIESINKNSYSHMCVNGGETIRVNNKELANPLYRTETVGSGKAKTEVAYTLDPVFPKYCAEHDENVAVNLHRGYLADTRLTLWNDVEAFLKDSITVHKPSTVNDLICNNSTTVRCKGCHYIGTDYCSTDILECAKGAGIAHYLGNTMNATLGCLNFKTQTVYYCQGHQYHGYNFYDYITKTTLKHYNGLKPCSNCKEVTVQGVSGPNMKGYICLGHKPDEISSTNTTCEYCDFSNGSYPMLTPCAHCTSEKIYVCGGHDKYDCPDGHKVCLGHLKESYCAGHCTCDGHLMQYCTGEPQYKLYTSIVASSELTDYLFDDWTYTFYEDKELFWPFDFITYAGSETISSTYLGKHQRKYDFEGWNEDKKEEALACAQEDWYQVYGISSSQFIGGQFEPAEISEILELCGVNDPSVSQERRDTIMGALKAVGNVPYGPFGNYAKFPALGENSDFFDGYTVSNGIQINNRLYTMKGLDKKYFADYCYWSGSGKQLSEDNPEDIVYQRNNMLKVNSKTKKALIEDKTYLSKCTRVETLSSLKQGDILIYTDGENVIDTVVVVGRGGKFWDKAAASYFNATNTTGSIAAYVIVHLDTEWANTAWLFVQQNNGASMLGASEDSGHGYKWVLASGIYD